MADKVVFLCVDGNEQQVGTGNSLKEAYEDLSDTHGNEVAPGDCQFYEAVEVDVEIKFVKKEVVQKITAGKKPATTCP